MTNTPWGYIIGLKTETGDDRMENENKCCECCRHKATPRSDETVKALQNRLSRIIGQLGGIKNMLDDNRYCGDILIQLAAAKEAYIESRLDLSKDAFLEYGFWMLYYSIANTEA